MATIIQYNKYVREKKQVSYNSGATWADVVPAEYRRGALIERNSTDCGYRPTLAWVDVESSAQRDIIQVQVEIIDGVQRPTGVYRIDGEATTISPNTAATEAFDDLTNAYERTASRIPDVPVADYTPTAQVPASTADSDSYYLEQRWIDYGDGVFVPAYPYEYRLSSTVAVEDDPDCGYEDPTVIQYRWVDDGYVCVTETVDADVQYRWALSDRYSCSGGNKYSLEVYQQSTDSGFTWNDIVPRRYRMAGLVQNNATDCMNLLHARYYFSSTGNKRIANKEFSNIWTDGIPTSSVHNVTGTGAVYFDFQSDGIPESAFSGITDMAGIEIPSGAIGQNAFSGSSVGDVTLGEVTGIGAHAFNGCTSLVMITIPSTVSTIGGMAFMDSGLREVTIEGNTPPNIGADIFANCNITAIYVSGQMAMNMRKNPQWRIYSDLLVIQ